MAQVISLLSDSDGSGVEDEVRPEDDLDAHDLSSTSDIGDPLDDLLGDFNSASEEDSSDDSSEEESSNIRMVSDDDGGLSTDFGAQRSSHSNRRKVRKVRKVKRPRNP